MFYIILEDIFYVGLDHNENALPSLIDNLFIGNCVNLKISLGGILT